MKNKLSSLLAMVFLSTVSACATTDNLSQASTKEVINAFTTLLEKHYIFPDKAKFAVTQLNDNLSSGEFSHITSKQKLAREITERIQKNTQDKHLFVSVQSGFSIKRWLGKIGDAFSISGIQEVNTLENNIGYLKLRNFRRLSASRSALVSAMKELYPTRALIIDLCNNGGGEPETVAFLSSYFFNQRTLLNTIYWKQDNKVEKFYTLETVPGKRYGESKPVFILTSPNTFSAAEEFSYDLQVLKRATIIGERTGGGAHPNQFYPLKMGFVASIPIGRAVNPYTKTNWEGVGIQPDIIAKCSDARDVALSLLNKSNYLNAAQ
jgi:hypothetical protein